MKNKAINALIEMGVTAGTKGFQYIVDAMVLFENEDVRSEQIMRVYEKIAAMHNASKSGVERCIRHAFETALSYGNLKASEKYLTTKKTTNGNLLHVLYWRLTQEE